MRTSTSFPAIWLFVGGSFAAALSSLTAKRLSQPTVSIAIDTSIQYQELDGFGFSEAFQRAENIFSLTENSTKYVLDLLFSQELGAGMTILRNGIGSSNSSASNFMNTIEPISPGSPSSAPNYIWDHYNSGQFPLAQQAYARGLQTLYGNAWSAPGFMKTNGDDANGGYLCGVTNTSCATGNWMQAYANYLVQYARFYQESGVKVTNIGFLNEPSYSADYASMLSDGTQAAEFIRVLAKTIKASGLDLKINCCDGIGWEQQELMIPALEAGPDPAINYLSVITGHGYESPPNFTLSTNVKTWLSEWADLTGDFYPYTFYEDGGPAEGFTWARNVQVALVDAGVSAFLYWIGAETSMSSSSLINFIGDTVIPTKRFWAFAQFSKFARPGARRIEATSSDALLTVSSFLNLGGGVAAQVLSGATVNYTVELKISGCNGDSWVQPYLTNNANNLTMLEKVRASSDGTFTTEIPALSLVSFVSA